MTAQNGQSVTSWIERSRAHFGHSRWFGGHRPEQLADIRRDEFDALVAEREELLSFIASLKDLPGASLEQTLANVESALRRAARLLADSL